MVEFGHKTGPMSGKTFQASEASGFSFPTHIFVFGGEHTKPSTSQAHSERERGLKNQTRVQRGATSKLSKTVPSRLTGFQPFPER